MLVTKKLGEDFYGSVRIGLAFAKEEARVRRMEVTAIRLHPLDQTVSAEKWPYGWPPLEVDEKTPRRVALFELVDTDEAVQLTLL